MKTCNLLASVFFAITVHADEPLVFPLWPEGVQSALVEASVETRKLIDSFGGPNAAGRLSNISVPDMVVYRPEKPNGTSMLVAPGGGYMFLSIVNEGTRVCEWLNSLGVTAVLLRYRTPTRDAVRPYEQPVEDALRAVGIVRHHSKD